MNNSYIFEKETISKPIINVGSTISCRFGALLLLGLVVFSLAGCAEAKKILDTVNITPPSERWGAIAHTWVDGSLVWRPGTGETSAEAASNAESACNARSGQTCNVLPTFRSCGALASGRSGSRVQVAMGHGDSRSEAQSNAIYFCSRTGINCDIVTGSSFCVNE